jgi:hypothetical protein
MNDESALKENPLVEELIGSTKGAEVVRFEGYVGASGSESVRLYGDLTLSYFADIPRDAIVHSQRIAGQPDGIVRLFLNADARIRLFTSHGKGSKGVTVAARRANMSPEDVNMCIIGCWIDHPSEPAQTKCTNDCMAKMPKLPVLFSGNW